jgi:hypothetical protein
LDIANSVHFRAPCQITDSGLSTLAKVAPQLTALNISHVYRVTNAGVAAVAQMTRLETLAITRQALQDVACAMCMPGWRFALLLALTSTLTQ